MNDQAAKAIDSAIEKTSTDIADASVDYFRIETEVAVLLQKKLDLDSATALLRAREMCAELATGLQQKIADEAGRAVEFPQSIANDLLRFALPTVLGVVTEAVQQHEKEKMAQWKKNHPDPSVAVDPRLV